MKINMETSKSLKRALWFGIPAGLLVAGACTAMMMMSPSKDLDLALSKLSAGGIYRAAIHANIEPVTVGRMHSWTVSLNTATGAPVEGASITVDGGMPQHGHGLPTVPKVTKYLGDGRYLVEGMKFNMPGWWTIKVEVDGVAGHDEFVFNLVL
ncbi:YtkA-like protein [Mycoplana dimorpha]|uniref:YtkA-like protein n=2 Tax=Mycoplana dimorpha TaxID=28320 RepID=A0A2T5AR07_MYCDI|nr:YtkA-like protein [Mycoplana dimorpha]